MGNVFQEFLESIGKELFNKKSGRKIRTDFKGGASNTHAYRKKEGGIGGNIGIRDKK